MPPQIIDLTLDGDESGDERTAPTIRSRSSHMPTPSSNHGLPYAALPGNNGVLGANYMLNGAQHRARGSENGLQRANRLSGVVISAQRRESAGPATQTQRPGGESTESRRRTMDHQRTGIKRQKISHVSKLQGPRDQPQDQDQVLVSTNLRVKRCLQQQLIPHVTAALLPYRAYLEKADRVTVGSQIAGAFVSEKSFLQELGTKERISEAYETYIINESKVRVAAEFKKLQAKGKIVEPEHSSTELPSTEHPSTERSSDSIHDAPPQDSEVSTEADETFSRNSNSQEMDTTPDRDDDEEMDGMVAAPRALPQRASRAENPVYGRPKRKRGPNKLKAPTEPAYKVLIQVHPDVEVQRQVQALIPVLNHEPLRSVESVEPREDYILEEPQQQFVPIPRSKPSTPEPDITWICPALRVKRNPLGDLLREREVHGMAPVRARSGQSSFKSVVASYFEDCFVHKTEWHDCSGTLLSLTWTGPDAFICGAVAHSDQYNMQYNKPGNLLLGSTKHDTLRSYPDHRTIRPIVSVMENVGNASEAMRQTQDTWLYQPVVATAYSEHSELAFTASFDKTVKIWSVMEDGSSMTLEGTLEHDNRVNLVATSKHHDRVATASESMIDAVRVYNLDDDSISNSSFDAYCGNKASGQGDEVRRREKWSYKPSTIQWGVAAYVKDLLLVGWSPRSDSGDDNDIPTVSRNTGELCLWDTRTSHRVEIHSAHKQNVFEVLWHPTQCSFLAATSPSGTFDADHTKTQIRLFGGNLTGTAYVHHRTFDCPGSDINELTIFSTSLEECFVTASCTDSCTYVYDSKVGDQPVHVLQHGASLDDEPWQENEKAGVKFAAWGNSGDRFYTGSSDGVVKAWDPKAPPGIAFVRNVLTAPGGIYAGSFSKDFSKLLIGDDSGKVHLLAVDDRDLGDEFKTNAAKEPATLRQFDGMTNPLLPSNIRRPKLIIPHKEPAAHLEAPLGITQAKQFLETEQLKMVRNLPFQGRNYDETLLYRSEAHEDNDSSKPLLPEFLSNQQFQQDQETQRKEFLRERAVKEQRLRAIIDRSSNAYRDMDKHQQNLALDLCFEKLSLSTQDSLVEDCVEFEGDFVFDYEEMPSRHVFRPNYN